ncbi:hypothetical protein MO973_30905 [Paenibacillus sp. TRM 82003]|nr:hypothetical protein [Paenibacillus sp. TRM 82003]
MVGMLVAMAIGGAPYFDRPGHPGFGALFAYPLAAAVSALLVPGWIARFGRGRGLSQPRSATAAFAGGAAFLAAALFLQDAYVSYMHLLPWYRDVRAGLLISYAPPGEKSVLIAIGIVLVMMSLGWRWEKGGR